MAWEAATRQQQEEQNGQRLLRMTKRNPSKAQELQHSLITRLRVVTRVAALLCL